MRWKQFDSPHVFVSSPGDVSELRIATETIIEDLKFSSGNHGGVRAYLYENEVPITGFSRWGEAIQKDIPLPRRPHCRAVVCILGERIGTPFTDRGLIHEVEELLPHEGRNQLSGAPHLSFNPQDTSPSSFPLTGTTFEYLAAMEEAQVDEDSPPVCLIFIADKSILSSDVVDPTNYRWGGHRLHERSSRLPLGERMRWEAEEYVPQIRQLYNFMRYVKSRGRMVQIAESYKEAEEMIREFLKDVLGLQPKANQDVCKGLEAYDERDASFFFGRESYCNELLHRFERSWTTPHEIPFFGITGESGVGKSSILRAGVISEIKKWAPAKHTMAIVLGWHEIASLNDRGEALENPLCALGRRLFGGLFQTTSNLWSEEEFKELPYKNQPAALSDLIITALNSIDRGTKLVIGLDQFESLIDIRIDPSRSSIVENLFEFLKVALESERIGFIYTCQTNRFNYLRTDPLLADLVKRGGHRDVVFPNQEIDTIIEKTLASANINVDREELEAFCRSLRDFAYEKSGPHQASLLPIVSVAIKTYRDDRTGRNASHYSPLSNRLWDDDATQDEPFDIGQVIERLAEKSIEVAGDRLDWTDEAADIILRRAVRVDHDRIELPEFELPTGGPAHALAREMIENRLLIAVPSHGGTKRARIVHQAVIDHWPFAVSWLERERTMAARATTLLEKAKVWQQEGFRDRFLLKSLKEIDESLELLRTWSTEFQVSSIAPSLKFVPDFVFASVGKHLHPRRPVKGPRYTSCHFLTAASFGRIDLVTRYMETDPRCREITSSIGTDAVYAACFSSTEMLQFFVDREFPVDTVGKEGFSAIHALAKNGSVEMMRVLLEAGADPHATDAKGGNAIYWATMNSSTEMVRLLSDEYKVDVDCEGFEGQTPLWHACGGSNLELVKLLVGAGATFKPCNEGWEPFHIACRYGNAAIVEYLLSLPQVDPNHICESGHLGIHLAIDGGLDVLGTLLKDPRVDVLKERWLMSAAQLALQRHKPEAIQTMAKVRPEMLEAAQASGEGLLQLAAAQDEIGIAEMLISEGANPERHDKAGNSAWGLAVRMHNEALISLFLAKGVDPDIRCEDSRTAIMVAAQAGRDDVVSLLLGHGADPFRIDDRGNSAASLALEHGFLEILKFILEHEAQREHAISIADRISGRAAYNDRVPPLLFQSVLKANAFALTMLLKYHPHLDSRWGRQGSTVLHIAAQGGNQDIVQLLLDAGVSIETENYDGLSPFDIAVSAGHTDVALLLLRKHPRPQWVSRIKSLRVPGGEYVDCNLVIGDLYLFADEVPSALASYAQVREFASKSPLASYEGLSRYRSQGRSWIRTGKAFLRIDRLADANEAVSQGLEHIRKDFYLWGQDKQGRAALIEAELTLADLLTASRHIEKATEVLDRCKGYVAEFIARFNAASGPLSESKELERIFLYRAIARIWMHRAELCKMNAEISQAKECLVEFIDVSQHLSTLAGDTAQSLAERIDAQERLAELLDTLGDSVGMQAALNDAQALREQEQKRLKGIVS